MRLVERGGSINEIGFIHASHSPEFDQDLHDTTLKLLAEDYEASAATRIYHKTHDSTEALENPDMYIPQDLGQILQGNSAASWS